MDSASSKGSFRFDSSMSMEALRRVAEMKGSRMPESPKSLFQATEIQNLFDSSDEKRALVILPKRKHMDWPCWVFIFQIMLERAAYFTTLETLVAYADGYIGHANTDRLYNGLWITTFVAPIITGFLADNNYDRYHISIFCATLYLIGFIILILTTMNERHGGLLLATILWTVGSGAMKTPLAALAGDQIPMEGVVPMHTFFSWYVFATTFGYLMSMTTSFARNVTRCKIETCYIYIFGGGAILFVISFFLLAMYGNSFHHILPEKGVCVKMVRMIYYSLTRWKVRRKKGERKKGLLYYADDRYPTLFIDDVRTVWFTFHFCLMCSIYWGIRFHLRLLWKKQSKQMTNIINLREDLVKESVKESLEYSLGDTVGDISVNFISCISIPLFNYVIYPYFAKYHMMKSLISRMTFGAFMLVLLCLYGGLLQMQLEKIQKISQLPEGNASIYFMNVGTCPVNITTSSFDEEVDTTVNSGEFDDQPVQFSVPENASVLITAQCKGGWQNDNITLNLVDKANITITLGAFQVSKNKTRILATTPSQYRGLELDGSSFKIIITPEILASVDLIRLTDEKNSTFWFLNSENVSSSLYQSEYIHLRVGHYFIKLIKNGSRIAQLPVVAEGQTTEFLVLRENSTHPQITRVIELSFDKMNKLLHVPMYILLAISDTVFRVALIACVYSAGPDAVKAFVLTFIDISVLLGCEVKVLIGYLPSFIPLNGSSTVFINYMVCAGAAFFLMIVFLVFIILSRKEDSSKRSSDQSNIVESETNTPSDATRKLNILKE